MVISTVKKRGSFLAGASLAGISRPTVCLFPVKNDSFMSSESEVRVSALSKLSKS